MRSTHFVALGLATAIGACTPLQRAVPGPTLTDSSPAHTPPRSADIMGEWVLGSSPDSTGAFAGARVVSLTLEPQRFRIVAEYPAGEPWVVSGTVQQSLDVGIIRLTPTTNSRAGSAGAATPFRIGEPIELLAGAADNSMVFAPAQGTLARPSSVWHRREAAAAAGLVTGVSTGALSTDSTRKAPPPKP